MVYFWCDNFYSDTAANVLYRLFNGLGLDIIHDSVIIFGETAVIEASVLTRREYFLFLTKIGKDVEKIEPEIFV